MANKQTVQTTDLTVQGVTGISDHTIVVFTWVFIAGFCQAIDIIGFLTNIINIMCFVKQGFSEPINISLLGLAIANLGCIVTQMFVNIFNTLAINTADLPFEAMDVLYITAAMPHLAFSRVNNWITAIITLEGCLCITVPLKMKYIVTPRRVWIIISCVFVIFLFSGSPVFAVNWLDTKFSLSKNRTIVGLLSTADKDEVEKITFTINSFFLPFIAFIIIIVCTVILIVNLRRRTKWIKTTSTVSQDGLCFRDQKVAKLVAAIAVLFIVCFVPLAAVMLAAAFEPNLNVGGKLLKLSKLLGNIILLMESVNCSANISIYYHMSKKYRDTFDLMFLRK